jgi:CRISPR-associated protein Cas1
MEVYEPPGFVQPSTTDNDGTGSPPSTIPARMLNEFIYCPRLFYLEWVQGEFRDNEDVLAGRIAHRRVDKEGGTMSEPSEIVEPLVYKARGVTLSSERLGLTARLDLLEGDAGEAVPVDYKKGHPPNEPGMVWPADQIQVGAQALLLRENGYPCTHAIVYYAQTKQRVSVPLTLELVEEVLRNVAAARVVAEDGHIPPPLVDSPKCPRCSLVSICLPDEVNALARLGLEETRPVRRLVPSTDSALPLYVQEQGSVIGKSGDTLQVKFEGKIQATFRLIETSQVAVLGNVIITPAALHELCSRGIPVIHFSYGNWFYGITHGMSHKNVELRRLQFQVASNAVASLNIAKRMVEGKLRNCRTLIRRNHPGEPVRILGELERLVRLCPGVEDMESLRGMEGAGGRTYFEEFGRLLKPDPEAGDMAFDFAKRNRRPPKDPVNALLSFLYSLLTKDATVTLLSVGFDPYMGFLHVPRYGRPSLALDFMEEFRPLLADSVVLTLVNGREMKESHFIHRAGSVALTPEGRKRVLEAYERRLGSEVRHPIFGYTVSYRRILEVQARLLGRHLSGELPRYEAFCTR